MIVEVGFKLDKDFNYYDYDLDIQRNKLIDELNSYGFNFNCDELGIDKLRSLYYKKECKSKNQNG